MSFFIVKVKEEVSVGNDGSPKYKKMSYVVEADSTTEAEANLVKHFKDFTFEWTVEDIITTKIREVILREVK